MYYCAAHQPHWRCRFCTNLRGKSKIIHLQFNMQTKAKNKVSSWNISLETQRFILLKILKWKKVWYMRRTLSGFDKITSLKNEMLFFLMLFKGTQKVKKYWVTHKMIFFYIDLLGSLARWGALLGLPPMNKEVVEMTVCYHPPLQRPQ